MIPLLRAIDPREFLASRADARAHLAEAQANLAQANPDVERYRPLVEANAIPKQTYNTAVTTSTTIWRSHLPHGSCWRGSPCT